jgi:hypothetical protein
MRMINRQMFPAPTFDFTKGFEQSERLGIVLNARLWRIIRQRKNLQRAIFFARDDAARFIWRIVLCVLDELDKLGIGQNQDKPLWDANKRG